MSIIIQETSVTVSFEELKGSPTGSRDSDGNQTLQRKLMCNWGDYALLQRELTGSVKRQGENTVITHGDDYSGLRCKNTDFEPADGKVMGSGGTASYEKAIVTASYEKTMMEPGSGSTEDEDESSYLTESFDSSVELIDVPQKGRGKGGFTYYDSEEGEQKPCTNAANMFIQLTGGEWVLSRKYLSTVPLVAWQLLEQTCNSDWITSQAMNKTFTAETLMFLPWNSNRIWTDDGHQLWDIEFRYAYKATGWNKFFVPEKAKFMTIFGPDGNEWRPYTPTAYKGLVDQIFSSEVS